MNSILYKLSKNGELIAITTISRRLGSKGRFLIVTENLQKWFEGDRSCSFFDADCGNFLQISDHGGKDLAVRITWLSSYSDGSVSGNIQHFTISRIDLRNLLQWDGLPEMRRLYKPMRRQAKIIMDARCHMSDNKLVRRAFIKAMRDNFQWGEDERIYLYPDYSSGYSFTEYVEHVPHISGGLIAHWGNLQARNGRTYTKVTFSIHT